MKHLISAFAVFVCVLASDQTEKRHETVDRGENGGTNRMKRSPFFSSGRFRDINWPLDFGMSEYYSAPEEQNHMDVKRPFGMVLGGGYKFGSKPNKFYTQDDRMREFYDGHQKPKDEVMTRLRRGFGHVLSGGWRGGWRGAKWGKRSHQPFAYNNIVDDYDEDYWFRH